MRGVVQIAGLFSLVSLIFLLASCPLGWLFGRLPPSTAYSADLLGSLLGVLAMAALAVASTGPVVPVAFAGVIFSGFLRESTQPAAALGSNLLGAVVGGTIEYTSMAIGLRSLTLLALVFYLLSYLFVSRAARTSPIPVAS